jgi:hypothetical protein
MLSRQEEQAERLEVMENDKRLRRSQGSTFFDHTHNDTGGRYSAISNATVIGTDPIPRYPQLPASSPWAGPDLVGDEPPLSDNPALNPPSAELEPPAVLATPPNPEPAAIPLAARSGLGLFPRTYRRA